MNKQQTAKLFDPNHIAAVEFLAAEDTNTVLGIWFRMLTLAIHDPEGRVRLTPGLHMDTAELAAWFHCTEDAVEATIQVMEQLQQMTRDPDGTLKLLACSGLCRRTKTKKSVVANAAATEKETEKEKRKEPKEKSKENNKKADIADAISDPRQRTATETECTVIHGSAEPPRRKNTRQIPLAELPEPVQEIVEAWNQLPLDNHFDGLFPAMVKQLQALLEQYGKEALRKAITNVANSQFLLGNSRNSRGWSITLNWMLNPDHLENILQGKYQDKKPRSNSLLFQPGDEQAPYSNGFYGTVVD